MNKFIEIVERISKTLYPEYAVKIGFNMDIEAFFSRESIKGKTVLCSLDGSTVVDKLEDLKENSRVYVLNLFVLISNLDFADEIFEANQRFENLGKITYLDYNVTIDNGDQVYYDVKGQLVCNHSIRIII